MDWPINHTDRHGFRGPWRIRNSRWVRRCHPSAAPFLARGDTDYQVRSDGYGREYDAVLIGPRVMPEFDL